ECQALVKVPARSPMLGRGFAVRVMDEIILASTGNTSRQKSCFQGAPGRQGPVHRRLAIGLKVLIGLGKMPAAQEAAMRRERRGVRGLEDAMAAGVDQLALGLRVAAPQQEDQAIASTV